MKMRSVDEMQQQILETSNRLSQLCIVVEDFDQDKNNKVQACAAPDTSVYQRIPRPYTRQSSDAIIRKILEEAEHRKHEFWKLIDEHKAVIENLKKIEQLEHNATSCKSSPVNSSLLS